jgi:hypothetical protein
MRQTVSVGMIAEDSEIDVTSESDAHVHVHAQICVPIARGHTAVGALCVFVLKIGITDLATFLRMLVCFIRFV